MKPRSKIEVYNDLDEEIAGIFTVMQDPVQCQALMRRLRRVRRVPYGRVAFDQAFAASRDPVVRAQRAITRAYLSFHHCALFDLRKQTFSDARHRTGHAKSHEWASYPRTLPFVRQRLQGVVIERRDALEVIRRQDAPDALFFVDPPYLPATRGHGSYRHELDEAAHIALLEQLRAVKGMVVLAG